MSIIIMLALANTLECLGYVINQIYIKHYNRTHNKRQAYHQNRF